MKDDLYAIQREFTYLVDGKCHNIDNPILNKGCVNTSITRIMKQEKAILGVDKVKR